MMGVQKKYRTERNARKKVKKIQRLASIDTTGTISTTPKSLAEENKCSIHCYGAALTATE